jgi:dolichol-phosphate mannosyltransferase
MSERILVITGTYNERDNIEPLVRGVLASLPGAHILIVDDNSPDGTGELADSLAAEFPGVVNVMHRPGKQGLSTAHIQGLQWAREHGYTGAITMDADLSHDPVALPAFVAKGREYPYVLGSRYIPGGRTVNWSFHRRLLSWAGNRFARFMLGLPAHDLTTGYRYVDLAKLPEFGFERISAQGYPFLMESSFRVHAAGFPIGETPIVFVDRRAGVSKLSNKFISEALLLVFRLRGERRKRNRK